MRNKFFLKLLALAIMSGLILAACGSSPATQEPTAQAPTAQGNTDGGTQPTSAPASQPVTIRYALWDPNQQPAYQACADKFQTQNPNITIKIEQLGWGDYWTNMIVAGFASGTAPDVFTNHLAKYPEFVLKNQLLDIQPFVEADKVDTSIYLGRLAELWMKDGKRYGLPKDWDTVAVFYNADMLAKAGIDPAVMQSWTWDPKTGGTFEQTLAKLTLDASGKNATEAGFDPAQIVQYGMIRQSSNGGISGQVEWGAFAAMNGFNWVDQPWGTSYHFDQSSVTDALQWYADLDLVKRYTPPAADVVSTGTQAMFLAGKGAMTTDGSWMIGSYLKDAKFKLGFGLLPVGPQGRKTLFNGLADSIWAGTKNPNEAWAWVKYAASPECANIVASHGVVFPAQQGPAKAVEELYKSKNVDVSAFVQEALDPNGTVIYPITDHAGEIVNIVGPAIDSILLGQAKAQDVLPAANQEINALFSQ